MNTKYKKPHAIFYGWWIVGACFLINVFVTGTLFYGFTAFFEPIAKDFGWSYAQVSLATSFRAMEASFLSPVVGIAVDRYGPRRLVFGGAICIGVGMLALGRITTLGMFYAAYIFVFLGMSACSSVVMMATVSNWFRKKLSMVMGISACGVSFGGLMVSLSTFSIDSWGWRTAIISLGLGVCGLTVLLSLVLRHKPERYGLVPDGVGTFQVAPQVTVSRQTLNPEPDFSLRKLLSDWTFWRLVVVITLCLLAITPVITHIMPYLSSVGVSRATASMIASAVPITTIFGRLGFGWLGDRFDKRLLTSITIIAVGAGLVLFSSITASRLWLSIPFVAIFAIAIGGNSIMTPVLVREYFGTAGFGTTLGFLMGISSIGQIVGSPLVGWIFDTQGSYSGAWYGLASILVFALVIMATTRPATTTRSEPFVE
jgi:sugar phosphate permease